MTSGEIKAGIVISSILKEFPEIYISREKDSGGAAKYRVESPEASLCEFTISNEEIKIASDSSFGGGEKESAIRHQIESLLKTLKIPSEALEMPAAKAVAFSTPSMQATSVAAPPPAPAPTVPTAESDAPGTKPLDINGVQFMPITGLVPIPSTSYVAQIGKIGDSWGVGVFRGRRSIGIERVSELEKNLVVGAMQKIIVIPLFSPYAMSRAVDRLMKMTREPE